MTEHPIADPLELSALKADLPAHVHHIRESIRCATEKRGRTTPDGKDLFGLVLDASAGFIPLWAKDTILRWQFAEGTLSHFKDPIAAGLAIERMLAEAIIAWGPAAPIKFAKRDDAWDFEVVISRADDCDSSGCVLARAFFPDGGRHQLTIYPMMFHQSPQEQLETLVHEIGHVFGLRHFFALFREGQWPAEIFGVQENFTIMNYGAESILTENDKADLARLYDSVWNGRLTHINGTPIRQVRPFHETPTTNGAYAIAATRVNAQGG